MDIFIYLAYINIKTARVDIIRYSGVNWHQQLDGHSYNGLF